MLLRVDWETNEENDNETTTEDSYHRGLTIPSIHIEVNLSIVSVMAKAEAGFVKYLAAPAFKAFGPHTLTGEAERIAIGI